MNSLCAHVGSLRAQNDSLSASCIHTYLLDSLIKGSHNAQLDSPYALIKIYLEPGKIHSSKVLYFIGTKFENPCQLQALDRKKPHDYAST